MDLLFRKLNLSESSEQSNLEILKCPFLRNINEPTNFSLASSSAAPIPACSKAGARGPIFEDGPNFDTAFSLFHGRDGVVPLSGRSSVSSDRVDPKPRLPHLNNLAADAASISLSSFGGPFSFNSFSEQWKKQEREREPLKKGNSTHEAVSNEWLANRSCPIAKSYRAVNNAIPVVTKTLHPPPGMKLQCPPEIAAAQEALPKIDFPKSLPPQPLPAKVIVMGSMGMSANAPLGIWGEHTKKFSLSWVAAVYAAVPFIVTLRKSVLKPKSAMAFSIAASILGQIVGSRAEQCRLQGAAAINPSFLASLIDESWQLKVIGANKDWNPLSLQMVGPKPGHVFC